VDSSLRVRRRALSRVWKDFRVARAARAGGEVAGASSPVDKTAAGWLTVWGLRWAAPGIGGGGSGRELTEELAWGTAWGWCGSLPRSSSQAPALAGRGRAAAAVRISWEERLLCPNTLWGHPGKRGGTKLIIWATEGAVASECHQREAAGGVFALQDNTHPGQGYNDGREKQPQEGMGVF